MGFENEHANRIVFDIETAPLEDAAEYLPSVEAPANYKDPVKIADYIAEKNAENLDRCGLDVDLCRVVAIGWQMEGDDLKTMVANTPAMETMLLNTFWSYVTSRHLVGFNCLPFDLPVLMRRSQYLRVAAPSIGIDKYRHPSVTDLASVLSFNGAIRLRGLSFYCKRFGIRCDDTMTGADIAKAVAESRWAEVEAHVRADVQKTSALASRLGLFRVMEEAVL